MFNRFRKPTIKARLIEGGAKAKVDMINITRQQTFVLLHMVVKQVAAQLKLDHRFVLNRLLDIDRDITRERKKEEKQARYGKKK